MLKTISNRNMKGDYCYTIFRDDEVTDPDCEVGVAIAIEFNDGLLSMVRLNWGPEDKWECPFDVAMEQHWLFSDEGTMKMMLLTGTNNGKELIHAIKHQFSDYANEADSAIIKWCKEEEIEYHFYYHREMNENTLNQLAEMRKG